MVHSKLTIGIPTLNRREMVCRLVESCLSQTQLPYEVIVSDDASVDGSFKALSSISHVNLKLIGQETRVGMVSNWNACLDACRSEWFVLLSDDDVIDANFVESIEMALRDCTDVDLLIVRCRIDDRVSLQNIVNLPPISYSGKISFIDDIFPSWCKHEFALPLAGFVFNTRTLKQRGGFSSRLPFAADTDTWIPIAFQGQCAFWHHAIASYVIHRGMTTRTFDVETLLADSISVRTLLLEEVAKLDVSEHKKTDLKALIDLHLKRGFGTLMILAARAKAKKLRLLLIWLRYRRAIPGYGLSALSIGAVLVPQPLIHAIGWPYRKWAEYQRKRIRPKR